MLVYRIDRPGKVIEIHANADPDASPDDDPFNGKYFIMGLTHRQMQTSGSSADRA